MEMNMQSTPRSNRLAIAFFGRRNVGKSSLINALTGQEVSLVSPVAGSTADPVSKSMELLPIGPITVIDTAGLDDEGELGAEKIRRAKTILGRSDLAVLVCDAGAPDKTWEAQWLKTVAGRGERVLVVENKIDKAPAARDAPDWLPLAVPRVRVSAATGQGLDLFKDALVALAAQSPPEPSLIAGLFPPESLFMLVTPQDPQAPKGRLILPQVQVIRDILDHGSLVSMAGFHNLEAQLKALSRRPDMVIVDAQVIGRVAPLIPEDWPVTAFSIIMARAKGDLRLLVEGARHIDRLKPGSRVLMAEACTHHA
ncbi:[FeFe] hydrogenase H-cluster maturation GTPase HydF, partial [Deltaproteobacteria bacterium OttesenSCG-928-M10]|nr:[FeFe] hydrogenase H-cluster maturation GTPase HydF [Deltaproteobacteria bacterium OttesenSCG-928-M10]